MQGAGGTDPDDVESLVLGLDLTGLEVYVCKGVKLGHHDVDIVGADAVGEGRDAFAVALARDGNEFTRLVTELYVLEVLSYHIHPGGVSHHDDIVGQFLGLEVDVEYGAVTVDDKF